MTRLLVSLDLCRPERTGLSVLTEGDSRRPDRGILELLGPNGTTLKRTVTKEMAGGDGTAAPLGGYLSSIKRRRRRGPAERVQDR